MSTFKEQMEEKIRQYSNRTYMNNYIKKEFLTDDGDADIFLNIESKDDLFDNRTVEQQKDLTFDVYDYIEEKTSVLSSNVKINLHFTGIYLTPREQEMVRHLLREHYAIELYKIQRQYIKYRNRIITLILFGILCLLIYALLFFLTDLEFSLEIFGFMFTFSLWEALDIYISELSEIKSQRIEITQNLLLEVDFEHKERDVI